MMLRGLLVVLVAFLITWWLGSDFFGKVEKTRKVGESIIYLSTEERNYVGTVEAETVPEAARGIGCLHAKERAVQMLFTRVIGEGRLCELVVCDNSTFGVDVFMKSYGFAEDAAVSVPLLSESALEILEAYSEGVNECLMVPWEFKLLGISLVSIEKWLPSHTLLILNLMSYLSLAEAQREAEILFMQTLQAGVPKEVLQYLFAPNLDGLTDEIVEILKQTHIQHPVIPLEIKFLSHIPKPKASNNWVISKSRSESGFGLGACDPHLDTARLPAVWFETLVHLKETNILGVTVPGIPFLLFSRSEHIMHSITYGFMDMVDFFIEEVKRQGIVYYSRKGDEWSPMISRKETIFRAGQESAVLEILETTYCILETKPLLDGAILEDGFYLCRAWGGGKHASVETIEAGVKLFSAKTVQDIQEATKSISLSANHLVIDSQGNIGFQQSGAMPLRKQNWSGLYPLPGWDYDNHWKGMFPKEKLVRVTNPPNGVLFTANNDVTTMLDEEERAKLPTIINLHMFYRIDRIKELLQQKEKFSLEDMKKMQVDLYSLQAEKFVNMIKQTEISPTLNEATKILFDWDLRYNIESNGAPIFDEIYTQILFEVFGKKLFGVKVWDHLVNETGLVKEFSGYFDKIILEDVNDVFGLWESETKLELIQRVTLQVVSNWPKNPPTWGQKRKVLMKNILFDGKLPSFLGFDVEYEQNGNPSTLWQGTIFKSNSRTMTFAPSWRLVTDFMNDYAETVLPGGPSGDRLSGRYTTGLKDWLEGKYKNVPLKSK